MPPPFDHPEQFGYKHLLWVYSGRRGIHCWISDSDALDLTDDQRKAIITYLEVIKGGKEMTKKVNVRWGKSTTLHPSIECVRRNQGRAGRSPASWADRASIAGGSHSAAYKVLGPTFPDLILDDQECFKTKDQWETLLTLFPDHGPSECSAAGR